MRQSRVVLEEGQKRLAEAVEETKKAAASLESDRELAEAGEGA
jgi:hypothetical protein